MARIAFLSTAHIHARGWIEHTAKAGDGRSVHAVWDDVAERGRQHAALVGAPFVADLERVLADPAVDGLVISAENTRHLPLLRRALATGKPVLCEKPLATTATEADEIAALVERHRGVLVNGYVYPFLGIYRAIARRLGQRALGRLTHVRFRNAHGGAWLRWFDDPALAWFHDPALSGGGGMLDEGTHGVHLLRLLIGPVRRVWATARNLSGQYPSTDDFGVVHLDFADGTFGTVEGSWVQSAGEKGLEAVGAAGALFHRGDGYVVQAPGGQPVPLLPAPDAPVYVDRLVAAVRGQLDSAELRTEREAALDAVRIMDAAARSVRSGGWVDIG